MKIYLDVSCLNRPFDDQTQVRIRLEAEAVLLILERFDDGAWQPVSSEMAAIEIEAIPDGDRRARVRLLLPEEKSILKITPDVWRARRSWSHSVSNRRIPFTSRRPNTQGPMCS